MHLQSNRISQASGTVITNSHDLSLYYSSGALLEHNISLSELKIHQDRKTVNVKELENVAEDFGDGLLSEVCVKVSY